MSFIVQKHFRLTGDTQTTQSQVKDILLSVIVKACSLAILQHITAPGARNLCLEIAFV